MASAPARTQARRAPAPDRARPSAAPDLRVVRAPGGRPPRPGAPAVIVAGVLALGSLLAVAGAQAWLAQGQQSLATLQGALSQAQARHGELELQVADEENPQSLVAAARHLGLVQPPTVGDLTQVTVRPSRPAGTARVNARRAPVRKAAAGTAAAAVRSWA